MNKGVTDELDWQKTIYQNQGKNNLKDILLKELQEKLDSISVESAPTEENYCSSVGFCDGLKFVIQLIKEK